MNPWLNPRAGRTLPATTRSFPLQGAVLAALGMLVVLWTLPMATFYETPPWDNVEELFWGGSLEWGYYKHPPLPSRLMGLLVSLGGRQAWLTASIPG